MRVGASKKAKEAQGVGEDGCVAQLQLLLPKQLIILVLLSQQHIAPRSQHHTTPVTHHTTHTAPCHLCVHAETIQQLWSQLSLLRVTCVEIHTYTIIVSESETQQ